MWSSSSSSSSSSSLSSSWLFPLFTFFFFFSLQQRKGLGQDHSCAYFSIYGVPYAVDRCNSIYIRRPSGINWQSGSLYRCMDNGSYINMEYYDWYDCSGEPIYVSYNISSIWTDFDCHGSHACDVSLFQYFIDEPCVEGYTDSYSYSVYVKNVCTYNSGDGAFTTTLLTCDDVLVTENMTNATNTTTDLLSIMNLYYFGNDSNCDMNNVQLKREYPSDQCLSDTSYTRYHVNCDASEEPLPIPEYEPHYCELYGCNDSTTNTTTPTTTTTTTIIPITTTIATESPGPINNNDADACSYVNWYGQPMALDACWFSDGTSLMAICSDNDTIAAIYFWEENTNCEGSPSHMKENGVWEFNCIGHDRCHSEYIRYKYEDDKDESSEEVARFVYATEVCVVREDTGYMITCAHDTMRFGYYETSCDNKTLLPELVITRGCDFGVNCNIRDPFPSPSKPSTESSSPQVSTKTTMIIVAVTVIISVIVTIIIICLVQNYRARNVAANKSIMLQV